MIATPTLCVHQAASVYDECRDSPPGSVSIKRLTIASLLAGILLCFLALESGARAQGQPYSGTMGAPIAPATKAKPWVTVLYIQGVRIQATVDNLAARMANETLAQASQRKAQALVGALNTQITAAIAAGTLPANTAMATLGTAPATVQAVDRFGNLLFLDAFGRPTQVNTGVPFMIANNMAGFGVVSVQNMTQLGDDPKNPPKNPKDRAQDPTGEIAVGNFRPVPMNGNSRGALDGTGAGSGVAMGKDVNGAPSAISFGVFALQGQDAACAPAMPPTTSCPGDFIATINPTPGEDDEQVLSALAAQFDGLFSTDGLTATYDPATDSLALDQALTPFESLFAQNTDPGLDLDSFLAVVPEPASFALLGASLVTLAVCRRRFRAAVKPLARIG